MKSLCDYYAYILNFDFYDLCLSLHRLLSRLHRYCGTTLTVPNQLIRHNRFRMKSVLDCELHWSDCFPRSIILSIGTT
nr:MAG TPA: hypothetical protein [Caudoviricetes sp.]